MWERLRAAMASFACNCDACMVPHALRSLFLHQINTCDCSAIDRKSRKFNIQNGFSKSTNSYTSIRSGEGVYLAMHNHHWAVHESGLTTNVIAPSKCMIAHVSSSWAVVLPSIIKF